MAFIAIDGKVRAAWLSACANIAAPTTAEIAAGVALEGKLTPDGLQIAVSTGEADTSVAGTRWTTARAARTGIKSTLKFHHASTADTPYTTLTYGTTGYLVIRRGVDATTAWTAGDKAQVYPMECGEVNEEDPKENGAWDYSVPLTLTDAPNLRAVVA